MSVQRLALLALSSGLLLSFTERASASTTFPDTVKDEWQLPSTPECTLCHQTQVGGFGTATKPFARALMKKGATAANTNALRSALRALHSADSDVDGDGVPDYDELQMGSDPNVFDARDADGGVVEAPLDDTPIPRTGCSVATVGRRTGLTATPPSPTVGPNSSSNAPSRRISGDALLVCGLGLGVVIGRLRAQRKRVASTAR